MLIFSDGCYDTFQSTLPAGEATSVKSGTVLHNPNFNPRFPRGKRRVRASVQGNGNNFNPRFPRGKRPDVIKGAADWINISIHASRGGSDQ